MRLFLRQNFNPRTPCGVRPILPGVGVGVDPISIHAPRVGCDAVKSFHGIIRSIISIHAPRVGCDKRE